MEYGAAYLRPAGNPGDDDNVSMLSEQRQSQYRPYRPGHISGHQRTSSELSRAHDSWVVSPVALQQSLPPTTQSVDSSARTRSSFIPPRAVIDFQYQEPVVWAHSTEFRSAQPDSPKPEIQSTVYPVPDAKSQHEGRRYFRHPRHISEAWKAGFWVRFPWWGFAAILAIILLTGVSAGILLGSNGSSPEDWRIGSDNAQPYIYVSVFEMIMNLLIIFALVDGIRIRFWRVLLKGTTLSEMHDVYDSAFLWPAVRRACRLQFNVVAVASMLAVLSAVRGPLFQRSLTLSENSILTSTTELGITIAPFPTPEYFQTVTQFGPDTPNGITPAFAKILRDLSAGAPMSYKQSLQCGQSCTGKVTGFAFGVTCTSSTRPLESIVIPDECKSCSRPDCAARCASRRLNELNRAIFSISSTTNAGSATSAQEQTLALTSMYKKDAVCSSDIEIKTCVLTQGKAEYNITITDGTIDRSSTEVNRQLSNEAVPLDRSLMDTYWPLAFESLFPAISVNITPAEDFSRLQYRKCTRPQINATDEDDNESEPSCTDGTTFQPILLSNDPSVLYSTTPTTSSAPQNQDALCGLTWRDPMPDMIAKMQSLAFRVTIDMANSDFATPSTPATATTTTASESTTTSLPGPWTQTIPMSTTHTRSIYTTSPVLVALGILLSLIGVIALIPLYNGFWTLGRDVSMNPLEIARAFGAPMLEGLDGNASGEMVTVERGGMAVKYGAVERFGEERKLRVEERGRATVRMPWEGEVFG